jgi:acyl-CoA synthetase (AMP-forming)/AMP-acid ligase II
MLERTCLANVRACQARRRDGRLRGAHDLPRAGGGSARLARFLHDAGLRRGDGIALLAGNGPRVYEVYWAAQRSGLYLTAANHHGFDKDTVYLSPAPLYHAAPLRFSATIQAIGGTVIVLDRFDPEGALAAIEQYRATHSQWVPTMFVRMLKLPEDVRERYDVSSMKVAIHAAAPCPPEVKRAMIDWWGPVLYEYYAATEGVGITFINSEQWLEHPGSVGRGGIIGDVRICDDETGAVLPPRLRARRAELRVPQRPGEDPRRPPPPARELGHHRRPGLRRRGGLALPHRPEGLHDHLRRGDRRPGPGDGRVGARGGLARPGRRAGAGAGARADRARPRAHRGVQGPEPASW